MGIDKTGGGGGSRTLVRTSFISGRYMLSRLLGFGPEVPVGRLNFP